MVTDNSHRNFFLTTFSYLLTFIFVDFILEAKMLVRTLVFIVLPFAVLSAITSLNLTALCIQELAQHNLYRARYGYPALTLNTTLATIAQNYSKYLYDTLAPAYPVKLVPSTPAANGQYGENLFWKWAYPSLTYVGGATSANWYGEKENYGNYASTNGEVIGNFTAMIWKSVETVGFGFYQGNQIISRFNGTGIFVVANYYPTPNVVGQYTTNLPLLHKQKYPLSFFNSIQNLCDSYIIKSV